MAPAEDKPVTVYQATAADLDEIVPLFDGYRQFYKQASDPRVCREFLAARLAQADSVILIARVEGRAVGFTQLYPTLSSVSMRRMWILNDLFVMPEARKHGVGTTLLDRAEQMARDTGAVRMVLSTATDNATAQRLYEQRGWEREQVFVQYKRTL
jgi:GNAT superfamily N-acetyltransferase